MLSLTCRLLCCDGTQLVVLKAPKNTFEKLYSDVYFQNYEPLTQNRVVSCCFIFSLPNYNGNRITEQQGVCIYSWMGCSWQVGTWTLMASSSADLWRQIASLAYLTCLFFMRRRTHPSAQGYGCHCSSIDGKKVLHESAHNKVHDYLEKPGLDYGKTHWFWVFQMCFLVLWVANVMT